MLNPLTGVWLMLELELTLLLSIIVPKLLLLLFFSNGRGGKGLDKNLRPLFDGLDVLLLVELKFNELPAGGIAGGRWSAIGNVCC